MFWKLVGSLELSTGEDVTDADLEPVCNVLSEMSVEDIQKFEDIMTEKLYALDTRAHARTGLEEECGFSDDGFLYKRCFVVANGKQYYEDVLANPAKMPKGIEFEMESLLYLANSAYQQKTGDENMAMTSELSYETGSNAAGWQEQ